MTPRHSELPPHGLYVLDHRGQWLCERVNVCENVDRLPDLLPERGLALWVPNAMAVVAPELLEALVELVAASVGDSGRRKTRARVAARAAIARAQPKPPDDIGAANARQSEGYRRAGGRAGEGTDGESAAEVEERQAAVQRDLKR